MQFYISGGIIRRSRAGATTRFFASLRMTNEVIVLLGELVQVLSVTPLSWLVVLAVEAILRVRRNVKRGFATSE